MNNLAQHHKSQAERRRAYANSISEIGIKYRSTTHYVLSALVPYTDANLKLTFKPSDFFSDLKKLDTYKAKYGTIRSGYYRAIKQGLIAVDSDGFPHLTEKGHSKLRRYEPRKLAGARLMVVFDIPENERALRAKLRLLLREFYFEQIQKSVWVTEYDVIDILSVQIRLHQLTNYVEVYEARKVNT